MSAFGSQQTLNMGRRVNSRGELTGETTYQYARSDGLQGGGNGYDQYGYDGQKTFTYSKSVKGGGMTSGMASSMRAGTTRGMTWRGASMGGGAMSGVGGGTISGMGYEFKLYLPQVLGFYSHLWPMCELQRTIGYSH